MQATGQCVQCGLCLPHCPTYLKTRNEAESPRGRLSLMRALYTNQLPPSPQLERHLNSCLSCRACEAVCPAGVPYGDLIDLTYSELLSAERPTRRRVLKIVRPFLTYRWLRHLVGIVLQIYVRSGLQALMRKTNVLKPLGLQRLESLLPEITDHHIKDRQIPDASDHPVVALFTGCVAEVFDRDTLQDARRLLTRLGYRVFIPAQQTCCGAIHQHNGQPDTAREFMERNLSAFATERPLHALVSTASGCGAQLSEVHKHIPGQHAVDFTRRHLDINQFLAQQSWPPRLGFQPLNARVGVHTPCSLTHVLKQPGHPLQLLARIPKIELIELPNNARCCGAAGSYLLTQPKMADALIQDKLQGIRDIQPAIVVTSNIGCRLHIQAALRREGSEIEVIHPVSLLVRQLGLAKNQ